MGYFGLAGIGPPKALALMRILMGLYATGFVAVRLPYHLDLARLEVRRFEPVGVWSGLEAPLPVWLIAVLGVASVVTGTLFTLGWHYRYVAPVFASLMLAFLTYGHCWGQVLHTEHLTILHLGVLAIAPAASVWSLDQRRRAEPASTDDSGHRWAILLMAAVTAATYFVAGWAKIRNGGMEWITGDVLQAQIAHDNLRKELLGDIASPFAAAVLPHRWVFPPLAGVSLLLEIGAPVALFWKPARRFWFVGIVGFHWGVLALMAVLFPYHLVGLAFLPHVFVGVALNRSSPKGAIPPLTKFKTLPNGALP